MLEAMASNAKQVQVGRCKNEKYQGRNRVFLYAKEVVDIPRVVESLMEVLLAMLPGRNCPLLSASTLLPDQVVASTLSPSHPDKYGTTTHLGVF